MPRSETSPPDIGRWIVFQPIVDLTAWSVVGFEALARFEDDAPPPAHLKRAEAVGARTKLELELIEAGAEASEQLPGGAFVTLNASGSTILEPEVGEAVKDLSHPWGIELYEGATPVELADIRARVSDLGGALLVDDAGAACADADRITRLRPDVVKIDRALFWRIRTDAEARRALAPLVSAADDVGASLLVEGVADADQVDLAQELGARYAQGFHLGMPTPAEGVVDMLRGLHSGIGVDAPGL